MLWDSRDWVKRYRRKSWFSSQGDWQVSLATW